MNNLNKRFVSLESRRKNLMKQQGQLRKEFVGLNKSLKNHLKAKEIILSFCENNQQEFIERVETLVTMCIKFIYGDKYDFKIIIERKRNQLEFRPVVLLENKYEINPKSEMGGGVRNIVGFALRIVLWGLSGDSRNTIILDEPFKDLGRYKIKMGEILKKLSKEMNLQFIIITHEKELMEYADKSFLVKMKNNISEVKEL